MCQPILTISRIVKSAPSRSRELKWIRRLQGAVHSGRLPCGVVSWNPIPDLTLCARTSSAPLRSRELKWLWMRESEVDVNVGSLAEPWVEIPHVPRHFFRSMVGSFVEPWVEINGHPPYGQAVIRPAPLWSREVKLTYLKIVKRRW